MFVYGRYSRRAQCAIDATENRRARVAHDGRLAAARPRHCSSNVRAAGAFRSRKRVQPAAIWNSIPPQHRIGRAVEPAVRGRQNLRSTGLRWQRNQSVNRIREGANVFSRGCARAISDAQRRNRRFIELTCYRQIPISLEPFDRRDGARP